jgi:L-ascorbate metabolism protein UlaG (beta-lactamase superfamily)
MTQHNDSLSRREVLILGGSAVIAAATSHLTYAQVKDEGPKKGELNIAWYGQSMFQIITPAGTRILTDPMDIEAHRVPYVIGDLLLMTHFHPDHTTAHKIENLKDIKQFNALRRNGPGPANLEWTAQDEKFKDVRFQSLGTYHDDVGGSKRGKNGVWIMDIEPGIRVVHLGDLGHLLTRAQLKKLGKVDILMVPAGGVYTVNGIEAFKVFEQIKPTRYVIPMHYGTATYDELLPLKWFLDEAKEAETPIRTFKPKEWLSVDPKSPLPKQASVAYLSYLGPGGSELPTLKKDDEPKKD